MWATFAATIAHPRRSFEALEHDPHASRHGALALLIVSSVYTAILAVFIMRGYPAAAPSALGLPAEQHYGLQIWYQVPLFFLSTSLTAGLLVLLAQLASRPSTFAVAFARIALATAIPFGLTTMLVEVAIALLLSVGVLEPKATLAWLTGEGAWFASLYQLIGVFWLTALVVTAVKVTVRRGWIVSTIAGLFLVVTYAIPIALLVR